MARQIRKSKIHKSNITRSKISLRFFWQLIIAFVLVIVLVGGGMSLAGRAALNRLAREDSIFQLGTDPVTDSINDASINRDRYLYGS